MTKLLIKLLALLGTRVIIVPDDILIEYAAKECADAEATFKEQSGEYKRHQVYSKLIKKFPEHSKRDISMAVEMGLNV